MKKYKSVPVVVLLCLLLAQTACGRGEEAAAAPVVTEETPAAPAGDYFPDFYFSATDVLSGELISEEIFREHTLTMVNLWEPWCAPCVAEMPELEKLYEDKKDEGFLILGVYATEDGMRKVLRQAGTTYPVILFQQSFLPYDSGYVPTSFFVDRNGHVLTSPLATKNGSLFVFSADYESWVEVLDSLEYDRKE